MNAGLRMNLVTSQEPDNFGQMIPKQQPVIITPIDNSIET